MKIKKIFLITLLFFTVFTISAINAVDNNATNELISSLEDNTQNNIVDSENSQDHIQINDDNSIDNNKKNILKSSSENISYLSDSLNKDNSLLLSDSVQTNNPPLKSSFLPYNYHDDYEYGMLKTCFYMDRNLKVKYKSNSHFEITLGTKDSYYPIEHAKIILKIWTGKKVKQYDLRTNYDGFVKFNTKKLKVGTHKVQVIYNGQKFELFGCKSTTKIIVKKNIKAKKTTPKKKTTTKKKKSKYKTISIKIKSPKSYFATKKLKTGDKLQTVYSKGGQYYKGVYAEIIDYDYPIHTKIKKVKFYFKNNGIIKTKTVTKIRNNKYYSGAKTKLISGYTPYKAKVWYK